jgi:hypothetical protein
MITFNRRTFGRLLSALALGSALSPAISIAADPVLLRYKFETGQKVRYSVQMRDDYLVQVGESQESPYNSQASIKSFRVISVDEQGNARLELTLLEQVRVEASQNGELLKYDSSLPAEDVPELFLPMQAMLGRPHLQLTVSPTGAVSEVTPLGGAKAEDEGKELAMDVLDRLPEEPMAVGARWTEDFHVPIQVGQGLKKNARMQRQYELLSVADNVATIQQVTKVLTPLATPEEEVQLLLRTPRVEIRLDLQKGQVLSRTLTLDNQVAGLERGIGTVSVKRKHVEQLIPTARVSSAAGTKAP